MKNESVSCVNICKTDADDNCDGNLENNFAENDILQMFGDNFDKQDIFDCFLTYRRRMARLGAVQALYLYDFRSKIHDLKKMNIFNSDGNSINVDELCQNVIYFYKNIFFTPKEYGWTKKNKKLDEVFMFELVNTAINSLSEIDSFIQEHLSKNWTTEKLDYVLRAIIRCAVSEILLGISIEKPILCSEYTNVAGNFFNAKEVGFVNGIVDKLYTNVIKIHPFTNAKPVIQ